MGGKDRAEEVASELKEKGYDVVGTVSTSAACFMSKARKCSEESPDRDVILALCCNIGAGCASRATGQKVVNPVKTLGVGYLDEDGTPTLL